MPISTYTPGYPPDGSSLGQTKATIRNNLDGTFQTLGVDHVNNNGETSNGLTGKPAGYHNIAHFVPQGSNPAPITGYGQLYSKTINDVTTDEALFWETGAGLIQQLTVNLTPLAAPNGYTYLPGGLILQWGTISGAIKNNLSSSINFNIPFPGGNCYNMQGTLSSGSTGSVITTIPDAGGASFKYFVNTNSSQTINFFWWAIGK